ncbi:MAG: hypothetical protein RSE24_04230 [Oscillospiraceae bacterium]
MDKRVAARAAETFRDMAIQDLKSYTYIWKSLDTLPKKIELLKEGFGARAVCYTSPRVQKSADWDGGVTDKLYDIQLLEKTLEDNRRRGELIKGALNSLKASDRQLLTDFYITRVHYSTLSQKFNLDRSSIYRKVNTALERYILVYYGVGKAG